MRSKSLALLLAVLVVCVGYSQAADLVGVFGVPNSSGIPPMKVDTDRVITIAADAGVVMPYELATTSDTITAVECGKTFIVNPSTAGVVFTLPNADVGCSLTFVQSVGSAAGTKKFSIDPQSTDTLRGVVNGTSGSTFAAGDKATSPGATGDSISIFCGEDTYWDTVMKIGTFVDSN